MVAGEVQNFGMQQTRAIRLLSTSASRPCALAEDAAAARCCAEP
ncbi:hypothetical protein [Deinococcus cavernae]|nr:hypothetical protein [Deinococcus cavernae]